jgi:two-component system, LuxR family, response regulator FixJ
MEAHTRRPSAFLRQITDASSRIAALTPRGRDVLSGILAGRSNKMIAYSLGISPRTVEIHRARLMRDLGARHVAEVIRLALEAGDVNSQTGGKREHS